jgi:hypothetical protein
MNIFMIISINTEFIFIYIKNAPPMIDSFRSRINLSDPRLID